MSILGPEAIAWLLLIEVFGSELNEDHAVAVSHHDATLNSGNIEHHFSGRNLQGRVLMVDMKVIVRRQDQENWVRAARGRTPPCPPRLGLPARACGLDDRLAAHP